MTVKDYLQAHPDKWSYTVKWAGKCYVGNAEDISNIFGDWELKSSENRFGGTHCVFLEV